MSSQREYELKFLDIMKNLTKLVVPHKTNLKKVRLGDKSDGGYVIAVLENDNYDALYSYGCDDNITFERAFHERYKKTCYVYDPFKGITDKPDYIEFFDEGLYNRKGQDKDGRQFSTLDDHIERNGHTDSKNLFGQIDIEGSEWAVFSNDINYLKNFSQLVVEFHIPREAEQIIQMEQFFNKTFGLLNEHFVCVHFHGNNAYLQPWADGYFPRAFEVTYVRRDLIKEMEIETQPCPVPDLDYACAQERRDLRIDYWLEK